VLTWAGEAGAAGLQLLLMRAIVQHPTIEQARSQLDAAGHDLSGARWRRFPTLSSELRTESGPSQNVARLEQPLWTGGKIEGQIRLAQATQQAATGQLQEAQTHVLTQVSTAYFELLRLQARHETAVRNVQEHQRLLDVIQRRVRAEISPPADETLAQARLQQAVGERIQIERQRDAARVGLSQWTREPIARVTAPRLLRFQRPPDTAEAAKQALAFSASLARLQAQLEVARAQSELSRAQAMPTVVAGHQRIWGELYSGQLRDKSYISLQFTPGAGLSALSAQQAASARLEAAQAEIAALQLSLQAQVEAAMSELDALATQLAPAQMLLEGTSEVVESYMRQYQIGRKNWLDVLNAQREKTSAMYNQTDMLYGHQLAQVRLLILTGELRSDALDRIHD